MTAVPAAVARAGDAILRVDGGRGFVIETQPHEDTPLDRRFILTAAHCLPTLPPPHALSYTEERTYPDLVAPLGSEPTIWAECLFVNPVADLAVLVGPDDQALGEQAENYYALVEGAEALMVAERPRNGRVWAFSLSGAPLSLQMRDGFLVDSRSFVGGMSGSPIVRDDGAAVGAVSIGSNMIIGCWQPWLWDDLPAWLVRRFRPSPAA